MDAFRDQPAPAPVRSGTIGWRGPTAPTSAVRMGRGSGFDRAERPSDRAVVRGGYSRIFMLAIILPFRNQSDGGLARRMRNRCATRTYANIHGRHRAPKATSRRVSIAGLSACWLMLLRGNKSFCEENQYSV